MKSVLREIKLVFLAAVLGGILATILGTFGLLDAKTRTGMGLGGSFPRARVDCQKVFIAVALPYLLVISFRLTRSIRSQLAPTPMK